MPFTSVGLVTGLTAFTPRFLVNGVTTTVTGVTYTEVGGGLYTINFTPTISGIFSVFIEGILLSQIEVVARTTSSVLQDLQDEALGSWTWDKTSGSMTMIRQDGTVLTDFNVVDTLSNASRERI